MWLALAFAEAPIEVPMMMAAVPSVGIDKPPPAGIGWTAARAGHARADLQLGRTVVRRPFDRLDADAPCTCDGMALACALLDDGSLGFRHHDPTAVQSEAALGSCSFDGHTFVVVAHAPLLPVAWEASPDHWNIPTWAGSATQAHPVPFLYLRPVGKWTLVHGGPCEIVPTSRRRIGVLQYQPDRGASAFETCAHERGGRVISARHVEFVLPWALPASQLPTSSDPHLRQPVSNPADFSR